MTSFTNNYDPGDTFPIGTTLVQYVASDAAANASTCSFQIVVADAEIPTIANCPANINTNNDSGLASAVVSWTEPTASDNVGVTSFTNNYDPGDTFPIGTTLVQYVASDAAANASTCSFQIVVADAEIPTIANCPANINTNNDSGLASAVVSWTEPTASDNVGVTSFTNNYDPGDTFNVGATVVHYVAADAEGNATTCSFNVVVSDVEIPTIITCPSDINTYTDPYTNTTIVSYAMPTADDNCSVVSTTLVAGLVSGAAFPTGITVNAFIATDSSGNTNGCSFRVTIIQRYELLTQANPAQHDTPTPFGYAATQLVANAIVSNAVISPADETNGTRYICTGWTGTGSCPASGSSNSVAFSITNDSVLTWLWGAEYLLDTSSGANGSVDTANGWYTNGATVSITATPATNYYFDQWIGDVPVGSETNNPLVAGMDQARTIVSTFSNDLDGDGLPDWWELEHFGDLDTSDGTGDQDNDGFTDLEEYQNGTRPQVRDVVVENDYDGDGMTDLAVYWPEGGNWYIRYSGGGTNYQNWGWSATVPVPGDYDGDGITDLAVYWPDDGAANWYVLQSSDSQMKFGGPVSWGWSATVSVPGDYDGDGMTDLAVYWPEGGNWYIRYSGGGTNYQNWGWNATVPVPGDYDGDGLADLAVYWPDDGAANWFIQQSSNGQMKFGGPVNWGWSATVPVPGDYDGDGMTDLAIYWPEGGKWYIRYSSGGTHEQSWGWDATVPVPGDYDGDGITDLAVYWSDDGIRNWFILQSSDGQMKSGSPIDWGWHAAFPMNESYWLHWF